MRNWIRPNRHLQTGGPFYRGSPRFYTCQGNPTEHKKFRDHQQGGKIGKNTLTSGIPHCQILYERETLSNSSFEREKLDFHKAAYRFTP